MLWRSRCLKNAHSMSKTFCQKLLSRLQRHCSGSMYIPTPQTKAEINMARVCSLQIHGHLVPQIAQIVGLSVRNIIKHLENHGITGSNSDDKIYETVLRDVVELVQRSAFGLIYVQPKMSQANHRHTHVKRMARSLSALVWRNVASGRSRKPNRRILNRC